ncbi:MAG: reverse transcriptase/maturase family protein [Patescibacteria group bacterium]|nr:reverse transcriptase/maturase family protein [Patescibacteria group bacterium]
MFEQIIAVENLLAAWKEFLRGKRTKPDMQEFSLMLMDNILALHEKLRNGTYRHGEYKHFRITDPKPRDIHKATVRDRLLHHAIHRVLYPFFDRTFIADSFSCRNGKGTHRAMNRFRMFAYQASRNHTRTCWVLKCDIRKFFASVDHHMLMEILRSRITDKKTLWLLGDIVGSFSNTKIPRFANSPLPSLFRSQASVGSVRTGEPGGIGLPLGNLTSQLLVNVYMNEFDQFVKHRLRVKYYVRYADDFIIMSQNKMWLETILPEMESFLWGWLKLRLHPGKVSVSTIASGVDFLGWVHFPSHRVLRTATKKRMMKRIFAHPTSETFESYKSLLSHGNAFGLEKKFISSS